MAKGLKLKVGLMGEEVIRIYNMGEMVFCEGRYALSYCIYAIAWDWSIDDIVRMVIGMAGYWTELYYAIAWNWTVLYDITWYFPILCGIAWYRIFFIMDKNCISNLFTNSKVASMDIRTAGELYQLFNFTKNPSRSHLKVGKYQDHS